MMMKDITDFLSAALPWICMGLLLAVFFVKSFKKEKGKEKKDNYGTEGMCFGLCMGTALGISISNNIAIGMTFGMVLGLVIGSCIEKKEKRTMNIETERLVLRPFDERDAESIYEYAKDPDIGPIAGWPVHTSVENSREIIRNVLAGPETYAVCLKADNRAIGSIGLMIGKQSNLDLSENEGEIGYWIGQPFWGRGLIPEAVNELIRHAFVDLNIQTLWCGYFEGNEKSKRCQEKCGFVYHHTNKDIVWELMNDIRTEHITRQTKAEWQKSFMIRQLNAEEKSAALMLAWKVFSEYEAPEYSAEGIEEFRSCLRDKEYLAGIEYFGTFDHDRLIGMCGIRKAQGHISLYFVDGKYHRLGIGTGLFERIIAEYEYPDQGITVNASPYAVPFYRSLGFVPTDEEQTVKGIRFTPMIRTAS